MLLFKDPSNVWSWPISSPGWTVYPLESQLGRMRCWWYDRGDNLKPIGLICDAAVGRASSIGNTSPAPSGDVWGGCVIPRRELGHCSSSTSSTSSTRRLGFRLKTVSGPSCTSAILAHSISKRGLLPPLNDSRIRCSWRRTSRGRSVEVLGKRMLFAAASVTALAIS